MKPIIPVLAVLLLAGCAAPSSQYVTQKQQAVLTSAEATCSSNLAKARNATYLDCLNKTVHEAGYWGQDIRVKIAANGTPALAESKPGYVLGSYQISGTEIPY